MKTLISALLAVFLVSVAAAAPIPDITFTAYPLGSPATYTVTAIVADPGGSRVWFTDQNFSQIGLIDLPTGAVTKYSVRPPGGETVLTIASSQALIFGPDGNLWFPAVFNLNSAPAAVLGRFAPGTGTLTYFPLPGNPFITLTHLAAGPDGNLWFTHQSESKLGKVTPAGAVSSISIAAANGAFAQNMKGLAFGADGNAWVTSGARSIFRVPTSGATATEYRLQGGSFRTPSAITRGPDDNLYFTQSGTSADLGNRIGRITPAGAITEWEIPTANSAPAALAFGSDGKIYFTEQSAKQLGQLDPATGAILESPIPNGETPLWIAAIPGAGGSSVTTPHDVIDEIIELFLNSLAGNQQDARAQRVTIRKPVTPGGPDLDADITLDQPLSGTRAGDPVTVRLVAENVGDLATSGLITMKATFPAFAQAIKTELVQGEFECSGAPVLTCTTGNLRGLRVLIVAATFTAPRPEAPSFSFDLLVGLEVTNAGDVNLSNNELSAGVEFVMDRGGFVIRDLPALLAQKEGRP